MGTKDPRVDAYIAKSAGFAHPVLKYIRKVVHAGCPEVEETLKWSMPHFMYKGMLCGMASFKGHCAFGFWKQKLIAERIRAATRAGKTAMGQFGRVTSIADLPDEATLTRLVQVAASLNEQGIKLPARASPKGNRVLRVPDYFMSALRRNRQALATFDGFSYSNRKEYVEWVAEAGQKETRHRRLETAIEWLAEGKTRNWKYIRK